MDITIQMRSLELLVKMLKRDMTGIPRYGYYRQKSPDILPFKGPLPRCTPEEAGVSSAAVEKLLRSLSEQAGVLGVHSIMLLRRGRVFAEACWAPYRPGTPHMLYSASKSITGTAIGMAADEGLISPDEKLEDIFPEYRHGNRWAREITVEHLLTMSSGVRFNEVGSALDENWTRMFMESVPKFQPGTQFDYNSLNSYMLAAALKRRTGQGLVEFLTPRLFEPLDITNHFWEACPLGTEKGGWGLSLCLEDLAKIAQLYLDRGVWKGKRLLSDKWIAAATSARVATPGGEMKNGYGYQIWISGGGAYQFNGAFGQYAVMFPDIGAAAVIYSGGARFFAKTSLMELLRNCFWAAAEPLPPYPEGCAGLKEYADSLIFSPPLQRQGQGTDPGRFDALAAALDSREFRLESNFGSLFPQILQNVHGCYSQGVDMVRFEIIPGGLAVTFYEGLERNTLCLRRDGGFTDSRFAIREEEHLVSTRGVWLAEGDDIYLTLISSFVETPDTRIIYIRVSGESIEIIFDETPSAEGGSQMLLEITGLVNDAAMRRLAPTLNRVHGLTESSIGDLVKKFSAPRAYGRLIHRHG